MRKILLLWIASLSGLAGLSQSSEIGIRFGANRNTLWGNEFIKEYHSRLYGFSFGVQYRTITNKDLSIVTAVHFERNGSRINDIDITDEFGNFVGKGDAYMNLGYLLLPVMARYSIGNKTQFFVNGGPFLGFLLQDELVVKQTGNTTGGSGFSIEPSDKGDHQAFNFGVSAGLGLHIPLGKSLVFETTFENHLGLYNIGERSFSGNVRQKTNSMNFFLGLSYKL